MNQQRLALGRRALACPHFRWWPGMDWIWDGPGPQSLCMQRGMFSGGTPPSLGIPIFESASSTGALLGLVRRVYDDPTLCPRFNGSCDQRGRGHWIVQTTSRTVTMQIGEGGDSEGAALVDLLERAPIRPGS